MTATLLPIPDDPRFPRLIELWPEFEASPELPHPRSTWLRIFEMNLRLFYPSANSSSLKLTARHAAPFPLALGKNVP